VTILYPFDNKEGRICRYMCLEEGLIFTPRASLGLKKNIFLVKFLRNQGVVDLQTYIQKIFSQLCSCEFCVLMLGLDYF
jgi:hypothetical protein